MTLTQPVAIALGFGAVTVNEKELAVEPLEGDTLPDPPLVQVQTQGAVLVMMKVTPGLP